MGKESRRHFQVLLRAFSSWRKRLKEAILVSAEMACCVHRVGITNIQPGGVGWEIRTAVGRHEERKESAQI